MSRPPQSRPSPPPAVPAEALFPRPALTLPAALAAELERALACHADAAVAAGVAPIPPSLLTPWFAASPFVAAYAIREPRAFAALLEEPGFSRLHSPDDYRARVTAALADAPDEDTVRAILRRLRNAELVRIACRDLAGVAALEDVLAELSALADALVGRAAAWLTRSLAARFGTPTDDQGDPVDLVIVAMGKLGGEELNFSSDIDLVFLYRAQGETRGGTRALANQEFFDRLGKKLIPLLNDTTHDGFVYRVDMRLRPFGDSGALSMNFTALEHYYQVHGRDWERYALIKGRVIDGEPRDLQALEAITRPFVFRRYLDFGALEAVRDMKALINAEVARYGLEDDVKRGAGGIREIEFIGQMFQLIRGGREPRLRQRSIVAVLRVCADLGLIAPDDVAHLVAAYRFLRVTEHRLQQVRDEQTQALPTSAEERARLAYGMGFERWADFAAALAAHREHVRQSFAALLAPGEETAPASPESDLLWRHGLDLDRTQEMLSLAGFADLAAASKVLGELKDPRFLGRLSVEARNRLDRLMPALVGACARHRDAATTLARLGELVRAIARRSVYIALLADNPAALQRLVDLCGASAWIARQLTTNPILLDELLDDRVLFAPPLRTVLENQLDEALANSAEDGLERVMEVLRVFKHQQVLRVAASDLMAAFPIAAVSNHLTWVAEVLIDRARAVAWQELTARHGRPTVHRGARTATAGFAIIAYGKLGGLELGYGSDLDLVFIHDGDGQGRQTDGPKPIANDVFFTRLAQRIIHLLATRTPAGTAYELDVRLRPSGAAGLLVTSLAAFAEYQDTEAWTWEHQALVRARTVAGHPRTRERFEALRRGILRKPRDPETLRHEIVEMRERMRRQVDRSNAAHFDLKHGAGGITDIEFMVQYAVLRWAPRFQALGVYTDNLRLLDLIADLGLIPRADSDLLREAYFAYRAEVHRCALQEIDGLVDHALFGHERAAVSAVWSRVMQVPGSRTA
ncbi:MAG: bifunctional [glutamate--ammonia ligase]-adenylyl-L-tyrosine phosphorylase/[glutamate--ammonia-ligase] adenylyltransferase [Gammaproteobacteria bacterium]